MANGKLDFGIDLTLNQQKLQQIMRALQDIQKKAANVKLTGGMNKPLQEAAIEAKKLEKILNSSWNSKLNQFDLSKLTNQINSAYGGVNKLKQSLESKGLGAEFNKLQSSVLNTNLQLKNSNKLLDQMAVTMANTVRYGLASSIFNRITGEIQRAYQYSLNLDRSLNDIRIVSDKSADDMERFAIQANKAAKALGSSTLDYTKASVIYYQQGLSDEETAARAETTLKAANVTGQTGEEVSEQLTAIWNGYKVSAKETELYIDKVAKVAASTAADLEEMATGMSKVASAAKSAGVDIDQLNATLSTVISVTREAPETVGTAFKTIYARLGDLALNGEDEYGVSLGNVSKKLHSLGIEILDETGNMRKMGEIVEETAAKWDTWTQGQRQAAAVAMAGKMQYSRLIALFDNWDMYTAALNESQTAVGTLQEQQDIYLESTYAHLQQLATEAERTYKTLFDQDVVRGFADALNGALKIFNNFLDVSGGGLGSLASLGAIGGRIFSGQISKGIVSRIEKKEVDKSNKAELDRYKDILNGQINSKRVPEEEREVYKSSLESAEKLYNLTKFISEEDFNRLNTVRTQIEENKLLLVQIEKQKEAANKNHRTVSKISTELATQSKEVQSQTQSYSDIKKLAQDVVNLQKLNKQHPGEGNVRKQLQEAQNKLFDEFSSNFSNISKRNRKDFLKPFMQEDIATTENMDRLLGKVNASLEYQIKERQKLTEELKIQKMIEQENGKAVLQLQRETGDLVDELETGINKLTRTEKIQIMINGITSIAMGLQSIAGILNTINDDTLTESEKSERVLSSLIFVLPMLFSSLESIKDMFALLGVKLGLTNITMATTVKEALGAQVAIKGLNMTLGRFLLTLGLAGIAITALIARIYGLIKAWNKDKDTLNQNRETLNKLKQAHEEVRNSYNELKESWSAYEEAKKSLDTVIKGTNEWNEALLEVNDAVLNLLDKYPQLANYITKDEKGLLSIEEKGYNEILLQQQTAVKQTQMASVAGKMAVDQSTIRSQITEIFQSMNPLAALDDAVFGIDYGYRDMITELAKYPEILKENKLGIKDILNLTDEQVDKIGDLGQAIRNANKNTEIYTKNMLSIETANIQQYQDFKYKGAIDKNLEPAYQRRYQETLKITSEMTEKEIANEYANINNKALYKVKDGNVYLGNTAQEIKEAIENQDGVNIKSLIPAIASVRAVEQIDIEKRISAIEQFQDFANTRAESLGDYILAIVDGNVAEFTEDQLVKLGQGLQDLLGDVPGMADHIKELFNLSEESIEDLVDKANIYFKSGAGAETYRKQAEVYSANAKQAQQVSTSLSTKRFDELEQDEKTYLENLEIEYEKLGRIKDRNSQEYLRTLRLIKEQEEDNVRSSLLQEQSALERKKQYYQSYLDKIETEPQIFKNLNIDIEQTREDFQNKIQEVLDEISKNKYNLQLQIEADIKSDVDEAFDIANQFKQLSEIINDDLTYTYEEAQKLIEAGYGEMFTLAEKTAEGTIKVNDTILNNFIDNKQAEYEADKKTQRAKLVNERTLLELQEQILQEKIDYLSESAVAEGEIDEATLKSELQNIDARYEEKVDGLQAGLKAEEDAATEIGVINEKLFKELGGAYADNSYNQQITESEVTNKQKEEINKRINNIQSQLDAYVILGKANYESSTTGIVTQTKISGRATNEGGGATRDTSKLKTPTITGRPAKEIEKQNLKESQEQKISQQEILKNTIAALKNSYINQFNSIRAQKGNVDAAIAALDSASLSLDKKQAGAGKGSGSSKDAKQEAYLEDEKDRYHDIDIILKQISTDLDVIQKQQNKLFGQKLIDNLNKQLQLLNKQIDATTQKIGIAIGETAELRGYLDSFGVEFNEDGTIANYADAYVTQLDYVNSIIDQYNNLSSEAQESFEDTLNQAKNNFNSFVDAIGKYDTLITETMPDLYSQIQDAIDKQIEINISKFNMEIEIRLKWATALKEWNQFKKKVIDGIKDDDILGNARARLMDFDAYYRETGIGIIQKNTEHIEDLLKQLASIDETGTSTAYGDNKQQALDDLKTYYDQLTSDLTDIVDLQEDIHKYYLNMIDEAADKFKEQVGLYNNIKDILDHNVKLIQLLNGEESYAQLGQYYEMMNDNYNKQLDFQRQQRDFWKAQMDMAEENSEEWVKAKENWIAAVAELNSAIEASVENVKTKYLNAIKLIFQELNKKVTGGLGLGYVNEQWELIKKKADQYLDTVNAIYGVQQLESKYLDALDSTNSITAQKKLNNLMEEELAALQQKDKLSQYDLDRANLRYQIALKQIALEEAQQNKSSLRLRRDSQGNYSYQFVADNDEVANLRQEISDLYNQLYNLDLTKYRENLDEVYSLWDEFQQKMAEAAQINDPEERQQKELLLRTEYGELINSVVAQNEEIRNGLYESTFLELNDFYDRDTEAFNNTLGSKFESLTSTIEQSKDIFFNFTEDNITAFEAMVNSNLSAFKELENGINDTIMNSILPEWTAGVQQMVDVFAGEGGFEPVIMSAMESIREITQEYERDLDRLQQSAGVDFDNIKNGIDDTIDETGKLLQKNDELIDNYYKQLDAIRSVVSELDGLINKYNKARDAALEATKAAYAYWQQQNEKAANEAAKEKAAVVSGSSGSSSTGSSSSTSAGISSTGSSGSGSGSGDGVLKVGDKATFSGSYYYDSYGTSPAGSRYSGVANGVVVDMVTNNPYGVHIKSADGKYPDLGWVKKSQLTGYDTGGYTGSWGSDGRLALLHQKELVLNKQDTKNFLDAVNILRGITDNMNFNLLNKMSKIGNNSNGGLNTLGMNQEGMTQNVTIQANFPDANDRYEIQQAMENLINIASQKVNKK